MRSEGENKMGVMPIPKLILNMSLPMILSMLVQALYNIVDSYFVTRFDLQALTAVSLAFPAQNLMIGVATEKPAAAVIAECLKNGVLVLSAKDKVRLLPPLNIPKPLLEKALTVLCAACAG